MSHKQETFFCTNCEARIGASQKNIENIICSRCEEKIIQPGQTVIKTSSDTAFCTKCDASFGVSTKADIKKTKCPMCPVYEQ